MPRRRQSKPNAVQQSLIDLRAKLGLTQEQLARELGVTSVTVARWETTRTPTFGALSRLASFAASRGQMEAANIFLGAKVEVVGNAMNLSFWTSSLAQPPLEILLAKEDDPEKRKLILEALSYLRIPTMKPLTEKD